MLRQAHKGFATSSLLRSWHVRKLELQLCLTDDIVEFPPFGFYNVLINPANEALVGTKLPYFPMQVEPPPELRNSRWCGMEAGSSMFYPMQVVDGRVHRLGGSSLREACERLPDRSPGVKCPTGEAVVTEATAGLRMYFEHIVHAVPPMYTSPTWERCLSLCWQAALEKAWSCGSAPTVTSPLLGAGARGAPVEEAARVGAKAIATWAQAAEGILCLAFCDEAVATAVEVEVRRVLDSAEGCKKRSANFIQWDDEILDHRRDEQPHLPELKRLAHEMGDSILKRLAMNATKWGLDQDALNGKLLEGPKVPNRSAKLAQLKARRQELETQLQRQQEEEDRRNVEVLGRFKAECDSVLKSQEQELLQLRAPSQVSQDANGAARFKQDLLEQLQNIQKQLAETKEQVSELDRLKQGLDKIEDRQRRAIPPIEALLASTMDTWPEDTEDELLAANIRKGEQAQALTKPNILGILAIVAVTEAASKHGFKVPPFLNCEGPTFHPIWSVFRESAIANAQAGYPRNESLREMAVDLITTFEPSMLLGARAWVVQLRSAATGDIYHLRRQTQLGTADDVAFTLASTNIGLQENLGRQTSTQAETDPAGFCLYGYVQALFIEFRHTIPLQEEGSELPSNDPRLAACHDRRPLLDVAEQLLGGETCETDFLESSEWPLKTFDLHLSLHSTLSLHSSSDCHVLFDMNEFVSRPHEGSWLPKPQLGFKPQKPLQSLQIAAFGLHVASTLEPVAALSEALRTSNPDGNLQVSYFGHPCYGRPGDKSLRHACVYKCQMLGSPCEDDAVADMLKGMFNSSGFYEEVPWSIPGALAALGNAWRDDAADLMVCSGPLVLCYLLDVLAPSKLMVMTLCSQLLWGAPPGEQVGAMLLGQVRMMSQNPRRALAACNVFAASQCLYQTGIELPVVERVAHYLPAVSWGPHESHWKEVLVLRARYWHRLPGQYFMDVLEAFLRLNEFSHNFTFVMAASFGPDELPPDEIAGYRATVLIPNDLTVFAFVEVYALGVPTFVPEASWLYRLRRAAPFGFLQPSMALPDLTGIHGNFRYPPFLTAKNDLEDLKTFLHWQQTSELHTRPHVQQFGSIPQLLYLTASADLLQISKGMREHSSKLRQEAADFWTSVLHRFEALRRTKTEAESAPVLSSFMSSGHVIGNGGSGGNGHEEHSQLRAFLDCSAEEHGAWNSFRHAFQSNAAAGFSINWELQAMAQSLWNSVQGSPQNFAAASALFHQVLIGDAAVELGIRSGHCHYGLVAALFILARHDSHGNAFHYSAMALQMLGGSAALDFLEDSAWPFSSLDLTLAILHQSTSPGDEGTIGTCPLFSCANFGRVRSIIEDRIPWSSLSHRIQHNLPVGYEVPNRKWKVAVVGVHPSLSADIAFAVNAALRGRTEHQYFGLSCPAHHSAVHHCSFRCEVLGQCSNDAIFDVILGQMLNFADFTQKSFDQQVLTQELQAIVSSDAFLSGAELQICTGPYYLCHMLQQVLDAPMLIYMGLTMTYMAPSYAVKEMLESARSIASDFTWMGSQGVGSRRTAVVMGPGWCCPMHADI
ncbi:unnamed protein product [Cladocopium goreaui]|uniref:PPPDE domain-containing protein n=1 Tax=Cladocopium goreaui TaxID=2562237 RepID=A0A9P1DRM4_9DINO|nr:unnamed protein product [Cladocopium goreaui]